MLLFWVLHINLTSNFEIAVQQEKLKLIIKPFFDYWLIGFPNLLQYKHMLYFINQYNLNLHYLVL